MYAGIAAFTKRMGRPLTPVQVVDHDGLHGYVFRDSDVNDMRHAVVAVAWSSSETPRRLTLGPAVRAVDLMGNTIAGRTVELTETPIYLLGDSPEPVLAMLAGGR
jgi:hypothetical protein